MLNNFYYRLIFIILEKNSKETAKLNIEKYILID